MTSTTFSTAPRRRVACRAATLLALVLVASGPAAALDLVSAKPPIEVADGRITIGPRTLTLPAGEGSWFYMDHQSTPITGGARGLQTSTGDRAFLVRVDHGRFTLAVELYLLREDLLRSAWDDLPCAGRQDIYFNEHLKAPSLRDCVAIRGLRSADLQDFMQINAPGGVKWLAGRRVKMPNAAVKVRYARFSSNTYGVIDLFVPADRFESEPATVAWAESVRSALKPVFEHRVDEAVVPALPGPPAAPPGRR